MSEEEMFELERLDIPGLVADCEIDIEAILAGCDIDLSDLEIIEPLDV